MPVLVLLIGRVAYVKIGSLDEFGSDGSTTDHRTPWRVSGRLVADQIGRRVGGLRRLPVASCREDIT